tara:strand:+ start:203 stop:1066 length:864 start_codon:yes stop_codon:yes gene_type:complete
MTRPLLLLLATLAPPAAAGNHYYKYAVPPGEATQARPVLVVGATGQTGSRTYLLLKKKGVPVRGIVLNASKARQVLGCVKCDASEGIFVADVTKPATLAEPSAGAGSLVIATGPNTICDPYPTNCSCPKGQCPIDVDWIGGKNMISAFARASAPYGLGQVVMVSSDNTCFADNSLHADTDPLNGFYKLNAEAFLMNSGLPYTIIKPCGLTNASPGNLSLDVFHNDAKTTGHGVIARADIARLIDTALRNPEASSGLRFDFCSKPGPGTPDSGLVGVLERARYQWTEW